MDCDRHHISILFDAWDICASNVPRQIDCKKGGFRLEYHTSFLSYILYAITNYMRVLFDLNCSFLTFDLLTCGTGKNRIFNQCNIENGDFLHIISKFGHIHGIKHCKQTKFVQAIKKFLSQAPSDFNDEYSYNYNRCVSDVIFIAKYNQEKLQNTKDDDINIIAHDKTNINRDNDSKSESESSGDLNLNCNPSSSSNSNSNLSKYTVDTDENGNSYKTIDFVELMEVSKIRNPYIKRVFIIRYCNQDCKESINTNNNNNSNNSNNNNNNACKS